MKFYITTPLYYVNAKPHIGHTYTTVAADCLARFYRMREYDVFFLTGTDEHGEKIATAAEKENLTPEELADRTSQVYKDTWQKLNISYTKFIRTTEKQHEEIVKKVFLKLYEKGDVYRGEYHGYYCIHCESYVIPEDEKNPICPDCKRKVEKISEPSYFFRLSSYSEKLLKFIEESEFVKPDFRKKEVVNFIKSGLQDLSITRKNVKWGIPCPIDKNYTIYVWFDALLNYLSGIGYLYDNEIFEKYWPADIQLIGKDIMRFHHIIWPAIIMALGLPLPKTIFAHGWWIMGKEKISKSKGNVVSPDNFINEYGVDPFRYFIMREVPFGLDGEYSEGSFKKRYNSDLVNDLGNLLNRTLNLIEKKCDGIIPDTPCDDKIINLTEEVFENYKRKMEKISFSDAIEEVWKLISFLNKYLDEKAPWRETTENPDKILYSVIEGIKNSSLMLTPFIPQTVEKIFYMLGIEGKINNNTFSSINKRVPSGIKTGKREILYPRKK